MKNNGYKSVHDSMNSEKYFYPFYLFILFIYLFYLFIYLFYLFIYFIYLSRPNMETLFVTHKSVDEFSKDDMFSIQPASLREHNEELGSVWISAVIGHRNPARWTMTEDKVLIVELITENTFSWNETTLLLLSYIVWSQHRATQKWNTCNNILYNIAYRSTCSPDNSTVAYFIFLIYFFISLRVHYKQRYIIKCAYFTVYSVILII